MFGGTALGPVTTHDATGIDRRFSHRTSTTLGVGDNTIRTPTGGRAILAFRFYGSLSGGATLIIRDGTGGTIIGSVVIAAAGTFAFDWTPDGALLTGGNAFVLNSSAAVNMESTLVGREG